MSVSGSLEMRCQLHEKCERALANTKNDDFKALKTQNRTLSKFHVLWCKAYRVGFQGELVRRFRLQWSFHWLFKDIIAMKYYCLFKWEVNWPKANCCWWKYFHDENIHFNRTQWNPLNFGNGWRFERVLHHYSLCTQPLFTSQTSGVFFRWKRVLFQLKWRWIDCDIQTSTCYLRLICCWNSRTLQWCNSSQYTDRWECSFSYRIVFAAI